MIQARSILTIPRVVVCDDETAEELNFECALDRATNMSGLFIDHAKWDHGPCLQKGYMAVKGPYDL